MKMQICALLFAVLAAHVAAQTATEVKWCIPYDQPPAYADLCTKTLAPANTDAVTFTCVVGKSPAGVSVRVQIVACQGLDWGFGSMWDIVD